MRKLPVFHAKIHKSPFWGGVKIPRKYWNFNVCRVVSEENSGYNTTCSVKIYQEEKTWQITS